MICVNYDRELRGKGCYKIKEVGLACKRFDRSFYHIFKVPLEFSRP